MVSWPVVRMEAALGMENELPCSKIFLPWVVPPTVLLLLNDMASLPVPPPAYPVKVMAPEVLLPMVALSSVIPSLLSDPFVPLFPVRVMAPPALYILLLDTSTIPRSPITELTPPVPVILIVPVPAADTFELFNMVKPWL